MAKQQRKTGMIVRIPIDGERDGFAQVLTAPEIAVFRLIKPHGELPATSELENADSLFRIWVMNSAITSGRWPKIAMVQLRPEFKKPVARFKRDPINGRCSIYISGIDRPASPAECLGLEPASVWSAEHVEARLRDHVQGRRHKPLDMLLDGIPGDS